MISSDINLNFLFGETHENLNDEIVLSVQQITTKKKFSTI